MLFLRLKSENSDICLPGALFLLLSCLAHLDDDTNCHVGKVHMTRNKGNLQPHPTRNWIGPKKKKHEGDWKYLFPQGKLEMTLNSALRERKNSSQAIPRVLNF